MRRFESVQVRRCVCIGVVIGLTALTLVVIGAVRAAPASAFKPDDEGHLGITKEALVATTRTVNGETLKFSDKAIVRIRQANEDTDAVLNQLKSSFHVDDEDFSGATQRLVNLRSSIIAKITTTSPDGEGARKDLGGALHTLQDFYSHTNWVEMGNAGIDTRLGRSTYGSAGPGVPTSPPNDPNHLLPGLKVLTSGYFPLPNPCAKPKTSGKTLHGWDGHCEGMNKDAPDRPGHATGRRLALEASKDYLNQILDASGVAGNGKAIKALMDIKGTLGMIIDTTGSMGGTIDAVKTQVGQIVSDVRGTDNAPDQYLLVPFNDPSVGQPFATSDPDSFLAAVNALGADGGGDCPELAESGLLQAVSAARNDSDLYLFTDASAKDGGLAGAVNSAAQEKQITISPILTGSCSPKDPAYISNATQTGGQLFFLSADQVDSVFQLVRPQLTGNLTSVLSAQGTFASASRTLAVPVDSTVTRAQFSASGDSTTLTVRDPSGAPVPVTALSTGGIVTIDKPAVGTWTVEIAGSGDYSLDVRANSPVDIDRAQFVELTGRVAHEGYFSVASQPLTGSDQRALAHLIGPATSGRTFKLLAQDGMPLRDIPLATGDPNAAADEFIGSFTLPTQPFRIAVTGTDPAGKSFQRVFPRLFNASSVAVRLAGAVAPLTPGSAVAVPFEVTTVSTAGDFTLSAVDNQGFVSSVTPATVTLGKGATATVNVRLKVPADAPTGTNVQLTFTATSTTDAAVFNSTSVELQVTAAPPAGPPVNTTPPSIIRDGGDDHDGRERGTEQPGTVQSGDRLRGLHGVWTSPDDSALSFTVQWMRCKTADDLATCVPIRRATSDLYCVRESDTRSWLRFAVTATNGGGQTTATSTALGPVRGRHRW